MVCMWVVKRWVCEALNGVYVRQPTYTSFNGM